MERREKVISFQVSISATQIMATDTDMSDGGASLMLRCPKINV